MSVTKFGVSAEKVVATIETPNSHQGIFLPERKNSFAEVPAFLEVNTPISKETIKNAAMIAQSIPVTFIGDGVSCFSLNFLTKNKHLINKFY
jgi:hypothetical protein